MKRLLPCQGPVGVGRVAPLSTNSGSPTRGRADPRPTRPHALRFHGKPLIEVQRRSIGSGIGFLAADNSRSSLWTEGVGRRKTGDVPAGCNGDTRSVTLEAASCGACAPKNGRGWRAPRWRRSKLISVGDGARRAG
jgi:hypothetical protein